MYGLLANFDVSAFVKKELTLVSFSVNTINLSFEEDVSITILGSFMYSPDLPTSESKQTIPVSSSNLMRLIGKVVCFAERRDDGGLTLHFDNGHILVILDDSREYESYSVRIGDKEIVV